MKDIITFRATYQIYSFKKVNTRRLNEKQGK